MTNSLEAEVDMAIAAGPGVARVESEIDEGGASSNVLGQITEVLRSDCSKRETHRQTFRLIAEHFAASYGMLHVRDGAQTLHEDYQSDQRSVEDVMAVVDAMIIEAEADGRANVRLFRQADGSSTAVLSTPIYFGMNQIGSFCLATTINASQEARILLSELVAILAFIGAQQATLEHTNNSHVSSGINRALEKAAKYDSIQELACSMSNNIAAKFNCEQVAFGLPIGAKTRLVAISGRQRFSKRSEEATRIRLALQECLAKHQVIQYQLPSEAGRKDYPSHHQWHIASKNGCLLSVPVTSPDGEITAMVTLRRDANQPFSEAEIGRICRMLQPFASVVKLLRKASRSQIEHSKDSAKKAWQAINGSIRLGRRSMVAIGALTLLIALSGAFLSFATLPHHASVSCQIVAQASHDATTPFDAVLTEIGVEEGQYVEAGQPLAQLDTAALSKDLDKLRGDIVMFELELRRAQANQSKGDAAIAQMSIQSAELQLRAIQQNISDSTIRSPIAGYVRAGVSKRQPGDLLKSGVSIARIGVQDEETLQLRVPAEKARIIRPGQKGHLTSPAHPDDQIAFEIVGLAAASNESLDSGCYSVDVRLSEETNWKPAEAEWMAKVQIGRKPMWRVVVDGLRSKLGIL